MRSMGRVLAVGLSGLACAVHAQDEFHLTSLSQPGTATFQAAGQEPRALLLSRNDLDEVVIAGAGILRVDGGQELMCVSQAGVVLTVRGPADVDVSLESDSTELRIGQGALTLTFADEVIEQFDVRVAARGAAEEPTSLDPGVTFVHRALASAALEIGSQPTPPFGADWAGRPGMASARAARDRVGKDLFTNIIRWDQRAGAKYVKKRVRPEPFNPEIRQITTVAGQPQRLVTPTGAVPRTIPEVAANEVPPLSPAAISLISGAEGVTAVLLNNNRNARDLLRRTGSIGLGFRGLAQLALPGFSGGVRTIGPAGLGATGN